MKRRAETEIQQLEYLFKHGIPLTDPSHLSAQDLIDADKNARKVKQWLRERRRRRLRRRHAAKH